MWQQAMPEQSVIYRREWAGRTELALYSPTEVAEESLLIRLPSDRQNALEMIRRDRLNRLQRYVRISPLESSLPPVQPFVLTAQEVVALTDMEDLEVYLAEYLQSLQQRDRENASYDVEVTVSPLTGRPGCYAITMKSFDQLEHEVVAAPALLVEKGTVGTVELLGPGTTSHWFQTEFFEEVKVSGYGYVAKTRVDPADDGKIRLQIACMFRLRSGNGKEDSTRLIEKELWLEPGETVTLRGN